jgi:MFS family permease
MTSAKSGNICTNSGFIINLQLIPFALVAWLGFLSVGIPLPVLSLFAHDRLGYNALIVGIVVSAQSLATLFSRQFAGQMCDTRGPKPTTLIGLGAASLAGTCYLASGYLAGTPSLAIFILIVGRFLHGYGESLFITATTAWAVARVGNAHTGRAMVWSGISMYGAVAVGAPIGTEVYQMLDFQAVAWCTIVFPGLGAVLAALLLPLASDPKPHISYLGLLRRIWPPGLAMALASAGVGTLTAFLPLYYSRMGWTGVGTALTAFGLAYLLMRLAFGGLPDKIGGFVVALASIAVEATGLLVIWLAPYPAMAMAGVILTGLGYSLIFPSLGIEAIKRASTENRGLALGAYLACFDLGIAMAGPVAGLVAESFGLAMVFPAAAAAATVAITLTAVTRYDPSKRSDMMK